MTAALQPVLAVLAVVSRGGRVLLVRRANEPDRLKHVMTFPGDPTTEALAAVFFLKLDAFLNAEALPYSVAEVRVEETPTNTVVLSRAGFDPETCGLPANAWPRRADMSINDFDRITR